MKTETMQKQGIALVLAFAMLVLSLPYISIAASTTEVVSGDTSAGENQPGWMFNRDLANATPIEFNEDEKVIGDGALYVLPISNSDAPRKFIGEYFWGGEIADLDGFSYDFKIGAGGSDSDAKHFYLNVYANFGESSATKFYDCKYDVVPTVGSTGNFTTVTFDPTQSYTVKTSGSSPYTCPAIPAEMDNSSPNSFIRAFSINTGDTSLSDADLDGYFDNVVLTTSLDTITYDFDPAPTNPATKAECMKGGYEDFGFKNQGQCVRFVETGKDSR